MRNIVSASKLYTEIVRRWCGFSNIDLYELVGIDDQKVCTRNSKDLEAKFNGLSLKTSLLRIFEAHFGLIKYINSASCLLGNDNYQYFLKKPTKEGKNFMNLDPADDSTLTPIVVSRMKSELTLNSLILAGRHVKFSSENIETIAEGMLINALIFNHLFGVSDFNSFTLFYTEANKTIRNEHLQINIPGDCYYKTEINRITFCYNDVKEFLTVLGQVEASMLHFVSKFVRR